MAARGRELAKDNGSLGTSSIFGASCELCTLHSAEASFAAWKFQFLKGGQGGLSPWRQICRLAQNRAKLVSRSNGKYRCCLLAKCRSLKKLCLLHLSWLP